MKLPMSYAAALAAADEAKLNAVVGAHDAGIGERGGSGDTAQED